MTTKPPVLGPNSGFLSFLESGHFADFTIKCQGHEWKVHKVIICAGCGFFRRLCASDFKEAVEDTVDFPEDDPKLIARLILFLYTGDYPVLKRSDQRQKYTLALTEQWFGSLTNLLKHCEGIFINDSDSGIFQIFGAESMTTEALMHALADKLDAPELVKQARKNYLEAAWMIDEYGEWLRTFVASVEVVYRTTSTTDRRLRDIVLFFGSEQFTRLRQTADEDRSCKEDALLLRSLTSNPEYAIELLTTNSRNVHVWCDRCQRTSTAFSLCSCGMRGICGDEACIAGDWTKAKCELCSKRGCSRRATSEEISTKKRFC